MTILPKTPVDIDISQLTLIHEMDNISLSTLYDGDLGQGTLQIMIHSLQKLLVLLFNNKHKIILASNSKAWLNEDEIMIPLVEGGLWKIKCCNLDQLDELQDILTFFIKYENRHSIKNTLALVDPVSCKVTKVVTNNVTIDLEQEDFIESKEKVPVYVDSQEKVKFLYQSGDVIMTGSDWIANALLFTGQTLAKSISSGSRFIEEKIEPNATCFKLSEQDKDIVDMVYNTTHTVTSIASDVMNKALDVAASGLRTIEPKTAHAHFGWSALKATATLIGGVAAAASVVLDSSREGIVQIVRKKYGDDAGYVAEKTVGTVSHVADLLVYFDAKGISRRVVLGGLSGLNQARQEEREVVFDHNEEAVVKH